MLRSKFLDFMAAPGISWGNHQIQFGVQLSRLDVTLHENPLLAGMRRAGEEYQSPRRQ
ncbi:MAG: hypothetical protein ACD_75C00715G0001, partial [uncultured bacterium]